MEDPPLDPKDQSLLNIINDEDEKDRVEVKEKEGRGEDHED